MSRRPALERRPGATTLVVGFALLLAGLLALVALASSGDLGGEGARGEGRTLPSGAFAYLYALFLGLGVLALPLFVFLYVRETPYSAARRRRARLAPFWLLGGFAVLVFLASRWPDALSGVIERIQIFDGDDGPAAGAADRPPSPEERPLAIVWGGLLVAITGVIAWQLLRPRRGVLSAVPSLAASLSDALEASLDDIRAEPDPRRAIVAAYARMESTLARCGVAREESEAPLEYLGRVLLELQVRPEPVRRLTELFERAKFSDRPVAPAAKDEAIAALEAVRDDLRELP